MHRDLRPLAWAMIAVLVVGFGSFAALMEVRRGQNNREKAAMAEQENRRILTERAEAREAEDRKVAAYSGYDKLAQGLPVSLLVIGDSIGLSSGASAGYFYWYNTLADSLKAQYQSKVTVKNVSIAGTTSYFGYGELMQLDSTPYDLVILCFGQNDPMDSFRLYYEALLRNVKRKFPCSSILSIQESSQRTLTSNIVAIADIADHYGASLIDTISAFNASGKPYDTLTIDGVHPNDTGYAIYAKAVLAVITANVRNPPPIIDLPAPLTPECLKFDTLTFVPPDKMDERADGCFYTTQADAAVGWSYLLEPSGGSVTVYINGVLCASANTTQKNGWTMKRTEILALNVPAGSAIRVVIRDEEPAPTVYGLLISTAAGTDA